MPGEFDGNLALVDGSLLDVYRLTAIQCMLQAERWNDEIVDQEDRAEQPTEMNAGFINRLASRRRAEARQRLYRGALPLCINAAIRTSSSQAR